MIFVCVGEAAGVAKCERDIDREEALGRRWSCNHEVLTGGSRVLFELISCRRAGKRQQHYREGDERDSKGRSVQRTILFLFHGWVDSGVWS